MAVGGFDFHDCRTVWKPTNFGASVVLIGLGLLILVEGGAIGL